MIYAVKLGPIATEEGPTNLYCCTRPEGTLRYTAEDDVTGLKKLLAEVPADALSCELALAEAGEQLGLQVDEDLPDEVVFEKAALAISLHHSELLQQVKSQALLVELADELARFMSEKGMAGLRRR